MTYKNIKFKWTDVEQKVFYKVRNLEHNNLLDYTNTNKKFYMYTYSIYIYNKERS